MAFFGGPKYITIGENEPDPYQWPIGIALNSAGKGDLCCVAVGAPGWGDDVTTAKQKMPPEPSPWRCEYCERLNKPEALECRGCGAELR